jgi:CRISPR/Cas system CSM-associated protein Csm3 (group 7 of RAMP superfamily)
MPIDRPQRRNQPNHSPSSNSSPSLEPKPYEMISFPTIDPPKHAPPGHQKYMSDRLHGTLFITLNVQTPVHISTGVVVMGSDIGNNRVPLIKTMTQGVDRKLLIQGSSLKGCIRSVYEAITNSRLGVIKSQREYKDKYPVNRKPCDNKNELCPASIVFGASGGKWGWQGLIEFSDATCERVDYTTGFMPSLYSPQPEPKNQDTKEKYLNSNYFNDRGKIKGRKFYYHTIRAIDKGENKGVAVQQAASNYTFTTQFHFMNLKPEELGTLLIILGQDPKYPIALKLGGGKPIGMGTMTVTVNAINKIEGKENLCDRYSSYNLSESNHLIGDSLKQFIQKQIQNSHSKLIEEAQLKQLAEVLSYPTDRKPPEGMY